MSYFDKLRTPSFRGFEFALANNSKTFGRDVQKHKIINSAVSYEDVGENEKAFNLEIAIGGADDFIDQADAFEAILAQKGPGRLVLPQTGELTAIVTGKPRRREDSREVGIVYFTVTFEVVEQKTTSVKSVSSAQNLRESSEGAWDAALSDFMDAYNDTVPDFVIDASIDQMESYFRDVSSALSRIGANLNNPSLAFSDVKSLGLQINSMFSDLVDFDDALNFSLGYSSDDSDTNTVAAKDVVEVLTSASSELTTVTATSSATTQSLRVSNLESLDLYTKISTTTAAATALSYVEYESKQEAITMRDDLIANMQMLRAEAGQRQWIESYKALGSLMAAVNKDVDEDIGRLPSTVTVKTQKVRSSIALAHRLYGDTPGSVVDMAADIVSRNKVIHPSFLPADELEVLDNV